MQLMGNISCIKSSNRASSLTISTSTFYTFVTSPTFSLLVWNGLFHIPFHFVSPCFQTSFYVAGPLLLCDLPRTFLEFLTVFLTFSVSLFPLPIYLSIFVADIGDLNLRKFSFLSALPLFSDSFFPNIFFSFVSIFYTIRLFRRQ